jgi:hypothetical protein
MKTAAKQALFTSDAHQAIKVFVHGCCTAGERDQDNESAQKGVTTFGQQRLR